jgi:hypothetical protein
MPRNPVHVSQGIPEISNTGVSPNKTTTLSPTTKMKHISPEEVLQGFFYDEPVLKNLNKHGVDVAKAHLTLLLASEVSVHASVYS